MYKKTRGWGGSNIFYKSYELETVQANGYFSDPKSC